MTVKIRAAATEDSRLLAILNAHVHDLHVQAEPSRYRPTEFSELVARMDAVLADPSTHAWVAEVDGQAVAHLIAREHRLAAHVYLHPQHTLLVDQLAVDPAHRRRGIGRALMDTVVERAQQRGASRVELTVRAHNEGASAFYAALGYVPSQTLLELGVPSAKAQSNDGVESP